MEHEAMIQAVLDEIDARIAENIRADELARAANYSVYHFCRLFMALTGTPVMGYVTRRKLEYALYDLRQGRRILDVAMDYGFETHAGFTKAFKKHFGYPPSLYHLHIAAKPSERETIHSVRAKYGGIEMTPYIIEMTPFTIAGRTGRFDQSNVARHADIPAFCFAEEYEADTDDLLTDTSKLFPNSKHCEVSMCYDVDPANGAFTYLLGRGVTHPDDLKNILPEMTTYEIKGLYAVFTTRPVDQWHREEYVKTIQALWKDILLTWLPNSEFEYDETRKDFEYYDYRDHGWYFDGKRQMDICIPIRQREEAKRRSMEKGEAYWREEMKRKEGLNRG